MAISENATHYLAPNGQMVDYGKSFKKRWIDFISKPIMKEEKQEEDNRPSEEIAQDIWKRIRGH